MKPNPVKKTETKEYCRYIDGGVKQCNYYNSRECMCDKHYRDVPSQSTTDVPRPPWCTDETFVRVKIEPVNVGDEQYCWYNMAKCSHYYFGGKDDLCTIMNRRLLWDTDIGESRKKRPESCRKLEV